MAPKTTKRRSPHEGGAYSYKTKDGDRWYWKATVTSPDGTAKPKVKRGFETKRAALDDLREALSASARGGYAEPSKQTLDGYLSVWLDGLRLAPSTVASYRKNVRLHIAPNVGTVPLASLTPTGSTGSTVQLEKRRPGRPPQGEGLSARTVRYIHTILEQRAAAMRWTPGCCPPTRQAGRTRLPPSRQPAPEMHPWTAAELAAFLAWAREHSELHAAWHDAQLHRACGAASCWGCAGATSISTRPRSRVRRSAGLIRTKGEGADVIEGPTKTGKPRVVDLDPGTVAVLRGWKRERGTLALVLAKDDALVFGDIKGHHRQPGALLPDVGPDRGPSDPRRHRCPADPAS